MAIIVRNYMRRRQCTGGFQRFRHSVFSHTARNVNHLSRCGRLERSKINIPVHNAIIMRIKYNDDQKDNFTQCVDVEARHANRESVRSTGTMRLASIISLLTISITCYRVSSAV